VDNIPLAIDGDLEASFDGVIETARTRARKRTL
jgi:hypothetical protein